MGFILDRILASYLVIHRVKENSLFVQTCFVVHCNFAWFLQSFTQKRSHLGNYFGIDRNRELFPWSNYTNLKRGLLAKRCLMGLQSIQGQYKTRKLLLRWNPVNLWCLRFKSNYFCNESLYIWKFTLSSRFFYLVFYQRPPVELKFLP